jgi:hypothetical protein
MLRRPDDGVRCSAFDAVHVRPGRRRHAPIAATATRDAAAAPDGATAARDAAAAPYGLLLCR